MKVIFLDFDGVLNSAVYRASVMDYYDDFIDESRMPLLKKIVDSTGAEIVLTTTWRHYWSSDNNMSPTTLKIDAIFNKYGLNIYSKTDCFDERRDFEICVFLSCNDVDGYVIIDDIDFGWSDRNRCHFIKTDDSDTGLDEDDVLEAIRILSEG